MRVKDFFLWGAVVAAAVPIGLTMGGPLKIPTIKVCSGLGFLGGALLAVQDSFARLAGFTENDKELRNYAFRPTAIVKYPVRKDSIPEDILALAK